MKKLLAWWRRLWIYTEVATYRGRPSAWFFLMMIPVEIACLFAGRRIDVTVDAKETR
jgi:hypothetical protein